MNKYNLWHSIPSNLVYEMPTDWMPRFGGWELLGTVSHDGEPRLPYSLKERKGK